MGKTMDVRKLDRIGAILREYVEQKEIMVRRFIMRRRDLRILQRGGKYSGIACFGCIL